MALVTPTPELVTREKPVAVSLDYRLGIFLLTHHRNERRGVETKTDHQMDYDWGSPEEMADSYSESQVSPASIAGHIGRADLPPTSGTRGLRFPFAKWSSFVNDMLFQSPTANHGYYPRRILMLL